MQFTGDAKEAADAFALKQQRHKHRLVEAAAAAAAASVASRKLEKRGGGGGIVDLSNASALEGSARAGLQSPPSSSLLLLTCDGVQAVSRLQRVRLCRLSVKVWRPLAGLQRLVTRHKEGFTGGSTLSKAAALIRLWIRTEKQFSISTQRQFLQTRRQLSRLRNRQPHTRTRIHCSA